jgi:DNA-binding NarL/FixJ family response regulator
MLAQTQKGCDFHTVLIVDDHPLFCDALSMTLQTVVRIGDIHTADRLEKAMQLLDDGLQPDAVMLDLNLPDVDGLDGLIRLKAKANAPIIVVSSLADNRVVSQVIRAGAAGYVPKHSQREVFRTAFDALRRGETFLPEGCVLMEDDDADDAVSRLATLTNQQGRILQLICEGKLNKQIAYDLSIAETTVKAHVTAIMRKLGVQSRTQAVLIAKQASFANVLQEPG